MALSTFNFQSSIKDVQNSIIASTIKSASGMELLRSEESIRDLIKSYTDRFQAVEGMLTDISKSIVTSKTVVKVEDFNNIFEGIYIDLSALYSDLGLVDNILNLNLARNKNYFLVIKKKVRELWQRLRLTRQNIFDLNPADESFYESFYSDVNIDNFANIMIDKKMGFISLNPTYSKIHNQSFEIKNINSTVYPVHNEEAGVSITTSVLNNLSGNYYDGTRDMLINGLWKEEVSCAEMPDMIINIGDSSDPIPRSYKGVVAVVDIEYTYPIEINRLDLDIFGDKALNVDAVLYREHSTDGWGFAQKAIHDDQQSSNPFSNIENNTIQDRGFDILSFMNINVSKIKFLRIVFNQQNYSLGNSPSTNSVSLDNKIDTDLSERRYDLLKFNSSLESDLTTPVNDENQSLYAKVSASIESTRDIEVILKKINDILVPPLQLITTDFGKLLKFEIGTWSIEPKYQEYTTLQGTFKTQPFALLDRHLIGASITANQEVPNGTTCNWYITAGGKDIPVTESEKFWRTEPLNYLDMSVYSVFASWPGIFFLLDLPIDVLNVTDSVGIYENGIFSTSYSQNIIFLNSRLCYLPNLTNSTKKNFSIRYPVAKYNCCNLYVLQPKPGYEADLNFTLSLCSTRRDILESFISSGTYLGDPISNGYSVTNALSTVDEAKMWFGESFSTAIFIDYLTGANLTYIPTAFSSITQAPSATKSFVTVSDIADFLAGSSTKDLSALSVNLPNVVPLSILRTV